MEARKFYLLNGLLFYLAWAACVGGAALGVVWGAVFAFLATLGQPFLTPKPWRELTLIFIFGAFGFAIDSIYLQFGMIQYKMPMGIERAAPPWICTLYGLYATSINNCLRWLRGRLFLASLLGMIGGSLSYRAGVVLGAITFQWEEPLVLAVIAIVWGILTPLSFHISQKINEIVKK